jgi:hypothetical protein
MSSEVIVAFITGVLGPLLVIFLNNLLNKKKSSDMVVDTLDVSEHITNALEHLKDEFEIDRVWITQFHNGGHFYPTGKSMAKFSIIYEVVSTGIPSIQNQFQSIPVNLFYKSINQLLQNDIIEINDFKDEEICTYNLRALAEVYGAKSLYLFAIKSIDNKFIGSMGVEYVKKKNKLDMESINHLQNHASIIGGVLMTHLSK